ncbi:MAG: hypothetical protein OEX07_02885, partial [Gammaproteobacteria bacterium]|nr:hypothetical protein [Gammaproteobacteria bacterium]
MFLMRNDVFRDNDFPHVTSKYRGSPGSLVNLGVCFSFLLRASCVKTSCILDSTVTLTKKTCLKSISNNIIFLVFTGLSCAFFSPLIYGYADAASFDPSRFEI